MVLAPHASHDQAQPSNTLAPPSNSFPPKLAGCALTALTWLPVVSFFKDAAQVVGSLFEEQIVAAKGFLLPMLLSRAGVEGATHFGRQLSDCIRPLTKRARHSVTSDAIQLMVAAALLRAHCECTCFTALGTDVTDDVLQDAMLAARHGLAELSSARHAAALRHRKQPAKPETLGSPRGALLVIEHASAAVAAVVLQLTAGGGASFPYLKGASSSSAHRLPQWQQQQQQPKLLSFKQLVDRGAVKLLGRVVCEVCTPTVQEGLLCVL